MAQFIPVICRSDMGDGGWSIHAPGSTDDDIREGLAYPLLTGTATMRSGQWSRPNAADVRRAARIFTTQAA